MKILIQTIPHAEQRYETCGDWVQHENGDLTIYVSDLGDWRYSTLVGIHEAIEAVLCRHAGIDQRDVDAFDIAFEKARQEGDVREPGDQGEAPYYKQHQLATGVERILAAELGVDWNDYETAVLDLSQ